MGQGLAIATAAVVLSGIGYGASVFAQAAIVQPSPPPQPHLSASPSPNLSPSPSPTLTAPSLVSVPVERALGNAIPQLDQALFGTGGQPSDRRTLLAAIDHSLRYLDTDKAKTDYQKLTGLGISRDRVRRSLVRFRELVQRSRSASALRQAIQKEFVAYQATGKDGKGTVAYTGYFEPVHAASLTRTAAFRYPIFRRPPDFDTWQKPHPTRAQLEGTDGLQFDRSPLKGLEIAWLRDRLEAFLIQVQGSARLQLTNGRTITVGYAGGTDYPYVGIGRELVKDGKLKLEDLTLQALTRYFQANPADLDRYLPRNQRFIFFKETNGAPPLGSLNVPVSADRSIATDKTLFPPGALALINTQLPIPTRNRQLQIQPVRRFVLDQDTGSAIKGAGRVDVFMGTGKLAGDRAGLINAGGTLYYILLKR